PRIGGRAEVTHLGFARFLAARRFRLVDQSASNACQPGLEGCWICQLIQLARRLEERLLAQFLGFVGVAQECQQQPEDSDLVTADQLAERDVGGRFAVHRHQLGVARLAARGGGPADVRRGAHSVYLLGRTRTADCVRDKPSSTWRAGMKCSQPSASLSTSPSAAKRSTVPSVFASVTWSPMRTRRRK